MVRVAVSLSQVVRTELNPDDEAFLSRADQLEDVARVDMNPQQDGNVLEAPVHEILRSVGHYLPLEIIKVVQSVNRYRVPGLEDRQDGRRPSGQAYYPRGN